MSPSRGAISRVLKHHALRLNPGRCPCRFKPAILPQPRILSSVANSATCAHHPRANLSRRFSTAHFHQSQASPEEFTDFLPICCPGCGAPSHTIEPDEPGYYSRNRKQARKLLASKKDAVEGQRKDSGDVAESASGDSGSEGIALQQRDVEDELAAPKPIQGGALLQEPAERDDHAAELSRRTSYVCDRCHDLMHHNKAVSAPKPSVLSIREILKESPYKYNRVYHVLDAADFPMSLIPRVHQALSLQEQRSRNRRASNEKYYGGRKLPTLHFIITRSDLLAATKDQVDSKMEYFRAVLRDALGRAGKDARLGNVHMISAHRGWWTKQVKEEIREHGGGIWVVGKANVGKSSFIKACFPKDPRSMENMAEWIDRQRQETEIANQQKTSLFDPDSLLPPAPREDQFPMLPVVSSMPGTTVAPIRIPFGRGKGEVIDLPGLERGELEDFVRDEHKRDLIMTHRLKPDQCIIKPGQSLLLGGGLVRITAVNPDDVVAAACFVPIETHITKTDKAIEMQTEQRAYPGKSFMKEGTGSIIASAGIFNLQWDITASNLPTSIAKAVKDKGIPIPPLPYRVMAADILIEGCGWIEVSVQVRAKRSSDPQIEVFTPNGKHVGSRAPIECWHFIAEKRKADKRKRPRTRYRYS